MKSSLLSILSTLVIAEFVLGNFANVFIALVNVIDWVKGQKVSCADGILTALAVSRIGLLWVILLNSYATVYNPAFYSLEIRTIVYIAWVVSNHFSLWLAASLSIFYLLKIANFSRLFFLHLKWKAKRVVLMVLVGSLVFLVCHLAEVSLKLKMGMKDNEGNITWAIKLEHILRLSDMTVFTIVHIIPFTMSLMTLLLLLFSLWKHLKKMQLSGKGSQDASTKVHVRAMQTVISFLLLFFIYFLARITSMWNSNTLEDNSVAMFCRVLGLLYCSFHSFVLIWGNKKLRQAILSFLSQLKCWLKDNK
ncbi:putative taste receptor type 2 member 33 [Sturnira hondurensis]|uniref:putative taste receptor type 2 member 33 n=1 Tax=Sturnira hondurensis TaxID=192404 RepID=UPI00187A3790|nr:putative taste receptor type 2 member 33 [Sturnira hondurensis]XP_036889725.1 putative taste receptor type 2 member 33 [Sturnira hondurensis]